MRMNIGDKVPEILGKDEQGRDIRLSDYRGRKLVLYFYPKDNTSGCTAEACSLRDHYSELQGAGYEVVGVSKDSAASHVKFKEKHELPFPLSLHLFFHSVESRIRQQPEHLAHHAELDEACLNRKPQATTHQCEDEHVAPYRIVYCCYQFIQIHLPLISAISARRAPWSLPACQRRSVR